MPRKSFFEDLRKHYITVECKAGNHADCPLEIPPREWGEHAHPCDCECGHRKPFITSTIKPLEE
jgi:hypothetical protein